VPQHLQYWLVLKYLTLGTKISHFYEQGGLQCLQAHIDFFVKEVGMSKVSMGKILGALPGLTCMSVDMQLRPTHMWLLKIGVPPARLERMLVCVLYE